MAQTLAGAADYWPNYYLIMLDLALPAALLALPMPWLVWRLFPPAPKEVTALRVPFFGLLHGKSSSNAAIANKKRFLIGVMAWLLLVLAAAQPQWQGGAIALPLSGRDLMLAIDVSGSMEIPDFTLDGDQVTRLTVVKKTADNFVQRRISDRIGLIVFGSQAYMQAPLTFDRNTISQMLKEAEIGLAGKETAIGDAIGLAIKRLRLQPENSRILVLLTDGANTAGSVEPLGAAKAAAQEGLRIYTIGIGADQLRINVPSIFGQQIVNPSADLDEKTLKSIATLTHGAYFRAKDTAGLEEIYQQLDEIEPTVKDDEYLRPVRSLYTWPLGAALLLTLWLVLPPNWVRLKFTDQSIKDNP